MAKTWTQGRGPNGYPGSRRSNYDVPFGVNRFQNPPRHLGGRTCEKGPGAKCMNMARWVDNRARPIPAYLCDKHVPRSV